MKPGSGMPVGGLTTAHVDGVGSPPDRRWGLAALEVIDEVSIVVMPDLNAAPVVSAGTKVRPPRCDIFGEVPPPKVPERAAEFAPRFSDDQVRALQDALVLHCERLKDRVAILDVPPEIRSAREVLQWRRTAPVSRYAAAYFPRIIADEASGRAGVVREVPPCGHVAGLYARTDREFGVHKPPANAEITGAEDVVVALDDTAHADLNDNGINAIRAYPGRGIRVFGARTMSDDREWRFLNVRRLLLMIEQAIDRQTQWVAFEPHDVALRGDLDRVVRSFLNDLWRRGMLDGATPADAFDVRCDESTNPPEEIELGRLICRIGVRPPAPAEFVVVRIGKTDGGTLALED